MIPRVIPLSNPLGKGELHHKNLNWDVKIREKRIFLIATNKKKRKTVAAVWNIMRPHTESWWMREFILTIRTVSQNEEENDNLFNDCTTSKV